ncbi:hypothetical protein OQA88_1055 [Cercophora sp. LCS_1]
MTDQGLEVVNDYINMMEVSPVYWSVMMLHPEFRKAHLEHKSSAIFFFSPPQSIPVSFCMAEQGIFGLKRKRQGQASERSQHQPKKQKKLSHPARPPPSFWDNLSEIPLTKSALHELDRRNRNSAHPVTRRVTAELLARRVPICLKRFARQGGPDLSHLRGYDEPAFGHGMSSNQSSLGRLKRGSTSTSKTPSTKTSGTKTSGTKTTGTKTMGTKMTKSTGPYDRAFLQHLIDFKIYPSGYEYPDGRIPPEPKNIEEIERVLAQPRPSLSPSRFSREDFRKFQRADAHAAKERQVTTSVIPIIEGDVGDSKCIAGEIPFTNLDHLTDGSLVPGNPDRYYGARPEQLDQRVRQKLGGRIIPSTQHDLPIVQNFFLAVKGPDGSSAVAQRQAIYDVTLGQRGMLDTLSYGESEPVYDKKAYAIACTYHAGMLKMYTSHAIPPTSPEARPEYVTTQVGAYALTGNYDACRQGIAAYRNGRDWAKQQRDKAIEQANRRVTSTGTGAPLPDDDPALSFARVSGSSHGCGRPSRSALSSSFNDPDTSTDELAPDPGLQFKRHKGLGGFQKQRGTKRL